MSTAAISWVFAQHIKPASCKFVLLAMAECQGSEGVIFPTCETLERLTSLDRKTILNCIEQLEKMGYLLDTGERRGRTKQVKVFLLNGLPSADYHYVYKLIRPETGEFFLAMRSTYASPEEDPFLGNGDWQRAMEKEKVTLTKEIIAQFQTRSEAEQYTAASILANHSNKLCQNPRSVNLMIPKAGQLKGPESGTASANQSIPFFPGKDPVFPSKASQKRDTDIKTYSSTDLKEAHTRGSNGNSCGYSGPGQSPAQAPDEAWYSAWGSVKQALLKKNKSNSWVDARIAPALAAIGGYDALLQLGAEAMAWEARFMAAYLEEQLKQISPAKPQRGHAA